jgi:hypothetical protein
LRLNPVNSKDKQQVLKAAEGRLAACKELEAKAGCPTIEDVDKRLAELQKELESI